MISNHEGQEYDQVSTLFHLHGVNLCELNHVRWVAKSSLVKQLLLEVMVARSIKCLVRKWMVEASDDATLAAGSGHSNPVSARGRNNTLLNWVLMVTFGLFTSTSAPTPNPNLVVVDSKSSGEEAEWRLPLETKSNEFWKKVLIPFLQVSL